jgi:hypothetical protein
VVARCTAFLCGLALLCLAGCGEGSLDLGSCVTVPQTFPQDRLVSSGATIHAPTGAMLWVALGTGYKYTIAPYPTTFPWLKPVSSDQNVLRPVRLCRLRGMYSLPVRITGFRAVGEGDATLLAKLAPPWRGRADALRSYHATVIVGR